MALHQIFHSQDLDNNLIANLSDQDELILIADGCYLAEKINSPLAERTYLLADDAQQRGVTSSKLTSLSDTEWVELTLKHEQVISWL